MWEAFKLNWHTIWTGHKVTSKRVTVPMFDPGSKGLYVECQCGKVWAI